MNTKLHPTTAKEKKKIIINKFVGCNFFFFAVASVYIVINAIRTCCSPLLCCCVPHSFVSEFSLLYTRCMKRSFGTQDLKRDTEQGKERAQRTKSSAWQKSRVVVYDIYRAFG